MKKIGELLPVPSIAKIISVLIILCLPVHANANDWNTYFLAIDRFYRLDNQDFKTISCNVYVPLIMDQAKLLRSQLEPLKGKVEIRDNLSDFTMSYSKNKGLTFDSPSLNIIIIAENGITDPEKVKDGIETVKTGFKQQISGIVTMLQAIFEEYKIPEKGKYKIEAANINSGSYSAKYVKDNSDVTEIFSQNKRRIEQTSINGDKIFSVENFRGISGGKFILSGASSSMKTAMSTTEMDIAISYENIKGVLFPTHIEGQFKQNMQTIKQEGQVDINFKNCSLH